MVMPGIVTAAENPKHKSPGQEYETVIRCPYCGHVQTEDGLHTENGEMFIHFSNSDFNIHEQSGGSIHPV